MIDTPRVAPFTPLAERVVLTLDETAALLGVSRRTVQRWAKLRGLPTIPLGEAGTLKRVLRSDLDAWLDRRRTT